MPSPPNLTNITPPRVALIDERTGLISREWYRFFLNLFNLTGGGSNVTSLTDLQVGPPALSVESIQTDINAASNAPSDSALVSSTAEIYKQIEALDVLPRAELGTMSALQQANVPWLGFDTTAENVPPDVGTVAWDGGTTLGVQATANVLIRVGEAEYVYAKASSAITKGQLCYHTGAVGSSGVITVAPTPLALADPNQIVGVAAETLALNAFGLIQVSGDLRGFNTTGSSVGETWADGDALYYNPAYVGSMTKVKPSAPNQKTYIGEVTNAGSGNSGSINIRIVPGSVLGGTDSNVQFSALVNGDLIQYDSVLQYWKNVPASTLPVGTATNIAGGAAGSVPYQSAPSTTTFLPIGVTGRWLGSSGTAPQWNAPAALTKVDDTNVTLTLGGTPSTALLNSASLTLGWTGTLAATRGGTGTGSYAVGDILYADTTSTLAKLADVATGNALISGGVGVAPSWGKVGLTTHVSGTLPVANGGTGLTAGTSGGVLYYSATGTLASSAALTANAIVLGGGAGAAPATTTTGTGVVTALGVNTGTAGAFVVNGGALGTPSSGTVTNLTGTASININGTVGATTPNTGAFTTLSSTGNTTLGDASTDTVTVNGSATFNASAVISVTDNTNAALRVTQLGTGNALLIEDSTNPDATPFVIDASGQMVRGYTSALATVSSGGTATTPALQTVGTTQAGSSIGVFNWSSAASTAFLNFSKSKSGTVGTRGTVVAGDDLGVFVFAGDDGTNFISAAAIAAEVQGTVTTGSVAAQLRFATTAVGGSSPTTRLNIDNAGYTQQLTAPILPYQGAPTSKSGAATLSGAELITGVLNTTGTTYTITLPTGTNIEGALVWAGNNVCLDWWVINTATGTITIGANGNTTLGALTIATGTSAHFRIRRTAANTFTVYRLS